MGFQQGNSNEVSVEQVQAWRESAEDFLLLDCREPVETEIVCIDDATTIPMAEIPSRLNDLEPFRTKKIVVYCHHGMRSEQVAQWLRAQGFDHALNMTGGVDRWAAVIDPELNRY